MTVASLKPGDRASRFVGKLGEGASFKLFSEAWMLKMPERQKLGSRRRAPQAVGRFFGSLNREQRAASPPRLQPAASSG
jgi:hypothetical protein